MGLLSAIGVSSKKTEDQTPKEMFMVGNPSGLMAPGNINILSRPQVKLPDGSIATVHSMSFYDDKDGTETLVPMISPDGKLLSQDEARSLYYKTGQHLGKFDNPDDATTYAKKLHNQQAKYYGIK